MPPDELRKRKRTVYLTDAEWEAYKAIAHNLKARSMWARVWLSACAEAVEEGDDAETS